MTDVVMLGAAGHARVLQESLALSGTELAGFVAPSPESKLGPVPHLGVDLSALDPATTVLVNGIGSVTPGGARVAAYEEAVAAGFSFLSVIDPTAIVRPSARLGSGVQVFPGAIVNSGAVVGDNVIINSGAIVEHDSTLGAHVHIAPGATLAGTVTIGDRSHVGLGARVLQGVTIGSDATIGAGAVVIGNIDSGTVAVGVPAKQQP